MTLRDQSPNPTAEENAAETDGWDQHMAHVTLDFIAEEVGRG